MREGYDRSAKRVNPLFHALQSFSLTRKLVAVACIAAVLFAIVVIVTFVATSLGTPVRVSLAGESPCVIADDVTLATTSALLRAPPFSA